MPKPTDKQQEALDVVSGGLVQFFQTTHRYVPDNLYRSEAIEHLFMVGKLLNQAICPEGTELTPVKVTSDDFGSNVFIEKERGAK